MEDHFNDNNSFLDSVRTIITSNLSNPNFSVEELAAAIPMHRSSFSRKLREVTGRSPSELIEETRMKEAWDLISSTELLITQIAFEVGFTELSNFSRAFKRHFGDSPTNIRNGSV